MPLKRANAQLTFRKEKYTICHTFYYCEKSGEQFSTTELDDLNLLQLHNQYRDKHNLPFTKEIIATRSKYQLPATKMSEILGLGVNSYGKYENGEVPSNSNGRLISMVNDPVKFKSIVDLCDTLSEADRSKINKRINALIMQNDEDKFNKSMELYLLGSQLPDELSGYTAPNLSKLIEMIKFFAENLEPWKTVMNKLLFYSDFLAYRKNCYSMSGVRYRAIKMGPVPHNYNSIYDYVSNNNKVNIINVPFSDSVFGFKFQQINNQEFNKNLFSDNEIEILKQVRDLFSDMSTKEVIEFSHKEKAWIDNEADRKLIDYVYAFDIDIDQV